MENEIITEAANESGFFTGDFLNFLSEKGTDILLSFLGGLALLFIGIKISKKIVKVIDKSKRIQKIDPGVRTFLRSALTVILYAAVISSTAIIWGIPTTSFMTVFASAGVAVGLALQGSLSNLAGGIMILLFKPFKVGDFIEGASCTGVVREITVMYTKLLTVDNKVVVIPNGALTGSNVTDYSTMPIRRVDLTISASYGDDIDRVKNVIMDTVKAHELVLEDPAPFVRLFAHKESSLDYTVRAWTKGENYWDVYFDLTENIKKAFDANGISIPFRQLDVTIKQ
ncbi:MAG: mechanosensitive ion channel [Lachnospiraceae bacterium]|nr:mechanosensitive ion channel [Lachnospiraceae bacterium]